MTHTGRVDSPRSIGARALAALLPDLGQLPGPRYRALSTAVATLLLDGRVAPGVRLPSERDLAAVLQLSRSTATAAYQQLTEDGLLVRRRGSGSYLRLPVGSRVSGPGGRLNRQDEGVSVLDLSIAAMPTLPGVLEAAATRALRQLSQHTGDIGYQPYGISALRERVARRYTDRGVCTDADQILVTNGAQHALDLLLRLQLHPGDRVVTELPTYPGALDAIRSHGGRVVAVPFGPDGRWDAAALRNALLQTSPRLAFLIPDFNNPTGALIGNDQRHELLAAARGSGTTVIADESFIDLDLREHNPRGSGAADSTGTPIERPMPMAAIDDGVVSIGSLSKPIWGGLRIGWIRTDPDTVSRLAMIRARSDMGGSVLDQLVADEALADMDSIAARRRAELIVKRDALLSELGARLPAWQPSYPAGGLSTWVTLDAPGATPLTHLLEQRGVLLTPGSRFAVDGTLERYLRIPFALSPAQLATAVERMAQAWADLGPRQVRRPSGALVPA